MNLVTVSGPAVEPVGVAELRAQCSLLDDATHDAQLRRMAKAARGTIETHTGCRMLTQQVRLELDAFPCGEIDLGVYPVATVDAVAYDDADGAAQTLAEGVDYYADKSGLSPRLLPVSSWPGTKWGKPACVRITMTVGWSAASRVPEELRGAVLMRAHELWERRGEAVPGMISPVSYGVNLMVSGWCRARL